MRALAFLSIISFCLADASSAERIRVRYAEGVSHGFMVLRMLKGTPIAEGENTQTATGGKVTSHLTFRFKDGSLYDDTTTFSQNGEFRLLTDHLVQKGPSFSTEVDSLIDASGGRVIVNYKKGAKTGSFDEKMELPADIANGLLFTIVKNLPNPVTTVSYLAITPKPRLIKLVFTREGKAKVHAGASAKEAIRYRMRVEIGGILGLLASVLNKKPPDTEIWVLDTGTPSYAGSVGPLYGEGPLWKIDLVSPVPAITNLQNSPAD
jgi:hypothetical protein